MSKRPMSTSLYTFRWIHEMEKEYKGDIKMTKSKTSVTSVTKSKKKIFEEQHVQFVNKSDLEFKDISSELYREYTFPGKEKIRIDSPLKIHVSESGGHRVFDASGAKITLVNYPRIPKERNKIWLEAVTLAKMLRNRAFQDSVLVMDENVTVRYTYRGEK